MIKFLMRTALSVALSTVFLATSAISATISDIKQYQFDVHIRGIKAGQLRYAINIQQSAYSIHGILESTGLVGVLVRYKFDAHALGKRSGNKFHPEYYKEVSDTGRRKSDKIIRYQNGVPAVTSKSPKKSHWVDPATQKGSLDPMTAMAALLSDQSKDNLCKLYLPMFDGSRRVDVTVSGMKKTENGVRCSGIYKRISGFTDNEWADGDRFPFIMDYEFDGNLYQLARFEIKTLHGRASFVRR